jgi:DNA adenine methylase
MTEPTRPVLRYHGGKWRLAPWIISHFPTHRVYVEPYGGGASVLVRKARAYAEIYNDLDGEVVGLFKVIRERGEELVHAIELTPYSRADFELSFIHAADPIEQARRTIVRSFMGFGGNLTRPNRDQTPQRTGWRRYSCVKRRSTPAGDWRNWPAALVDLIERLRGVFIENRDALQSMREHDTPETLHYVDPPYVHATRGFSAGGSHRGYRFEMNDDDHRAMGAVLHALSGMVAVSGYACRLYDVDLFAGWERLERQHVADGARARTEVLWLNHACSEALRRDRHQGSFLDVAGGRA